MVFAILVSWGIAFVEYCFAVPAQRGLLARRAEEHTGSHHAYRFCRVYRVLFPRAAYAHSRSGFRSDWSRRDAGLSRSILK